MSPQEIFYTRRHRVVTYPGIRPGSYLITEFGDAFDLINHIPYATLIKPILNQYGYLQVRMFGLNGETKLPVVSRLVAWEFLLDTRDMDLEVDHLDSNKLNNHFSNLEWVTRQENQRRAYRNQLIGSMSSTAYKTDAQITLVCSLLASTDLSYDAICAKAGMQLNQNQAKGLCSDILNGSYWTRISSNFDFSKRLASRRRFITPEEKAWMLWMHLNGFSDVEIYEWLYKKPLTKKAYESFSRVMQRVVSNGGSSTNL